MSQEISWPVQYLDIYMKKSSIFFGKFMLTMPFATD